MLGVLHTKAENTSSLLQICQKFCYCVKITWLFPFFFWQACITDTCKWFWWWNSVPRLLILGIARRVFRGFWKHLREGTKNVQKIAKLLQQVGSDITVTGCTHKLNFMDLSHRSVGAMWETHIPSLRLAVSQVVGESLVGSLTLSWRTATGCNS